MSEKEKKILEDIATAISRTSDSDKAYLLGMEKAMVSQKKIAENMKESMETVAKTGSWETLDRNKNKELDETIIQTCKWIQKKLQISDKSIRDEKVPEMMSALAELVIARAGKNVTHPHRV